MLLAIDIGNTNTVFAVCNGEDAPINKWRISTNATHTSDEYALLVTQLLALKNIAISDISHAIISCVVPQTLFSIITFCKNHLGCTPLVVGDNNTKLPITAEIDRPAELGADRLVNAIAAFAQYKKPSIVVDFGTATTFDVVGDTGNYQGGVIAPGIHLSIDALHRAAARLPEIEIKKPSKVVGTSTTGAMQSGIYWGYVGLIEGIIQHITSEKNTEMTVVATGGLAPLFFNATDAIAHLEQDLTIQGLLEIFKHNTTA